MSPLLVLLMTKRTGASVNVGDIFLKLGVSVIVPMVLGEIVQYFFPRPSAALRERVNFTVVSQVALLLFVYALFCDTFTEALVIVRGPCDPTKATKGPNVPSHAPVLGRHRGRSRGPLGWQPPDQVVALLAVVMALHFSYLALAWGVMAVPWWAFNRADRLAGFFVASQKTMSVRFPSRGSMRLRAPSEHALACAESGSGIRWADADMTARPREEGGGATIAGGTVRLPDPDGRASGQRAVCVERQGHHADCVRDAAAADSASVPAVCGRPLGAALSRYDQARLHRCGHWWFARPDPGRVVLRGLPLPWMAPAPSSLERPSRRRNGRRDGDGVGAGRGRVRGRSSTWP